MAMIQTLTLNMVAGNGYVITLPKPVGSVTLLARAECYVKIVGDGLAPSTPTSAAIPSSGATSDFFHMMTSDSVVAEGDVTINPQIEYTKYIAVWAVGNGNLTVFSLVRS